MRSIMSWMQRAVRHGNRVYALVEQMEKPQLEDWFADLCCSMQSMLRSRRTDSTRSFVDKAIEYVQDNYADQELTVDKICSALGVSAAYFSTVFKKETGKSFISYLTEFRMGKAAELLTEQNEKTYIIAQKVGYADPNYFSYVFKKQFGTAPSRYREENG